MKCAGKFYACMLNSFPYSFFFSVWLTFTTDTIMTVCGTIAAWNTLVKGWGNISTIAQLDWAFVSLPCLSALGTLSGSL
jgi:hypothetical protein